MSEFKSVCCSETGCGSRLLLLGFDIHTFSLTLNTFCVEPFLTPNSYVETICIKSHCIFNGLSS